MDQCPYEFVLSGAGEDWMNVDFINVKRNVGQEVHHTFDVRTLSDIF